MSPRTHLVLVLVPALLLGACGKGYDQEIILQLFRPPTSNAEHKKVTVTASENGTSSQQTLDSPFDSCSTNQVRIIPKQSPGTVHVDVKVPDLEVFAIDISVPAPTPVNVVRVILGGSSDLIPSGCAPGRDLGVHVDAAKRGLAQPCGSDADCAGGICLTSVVNAEPSFSVGDGYCTQACASADAGPGGACPAGAICREFRTTGGSLINSRCLKSCTKEDPCPPHNPSLRCSTLGVCVPEL